MKEKNRCEWVKLSNPQYVKYHDEEWGRPVRDDHRLFEMLVLEGAQAGLSWETILNKRENFRKAFKSFDVQKCSRLTDKFLEKALENPGIVRNRLKVFAVRKNAKAFIAVQKEFGSFSEYLWSFVEGEPIVVRHKKLQDYPVKTELSDRISKDLKKRGFSFVGSIIIYAYLQAVGVVDAHQKGCFLDV